MGVVLGTDTISLPAGPAAPIISGVRPPNIQGRFHGLSVLLVEDNDRLRRVLQLSLAEIGFAVTAAASGDAARTLLEDGPCPSLLFSDIRMPGQLDGLQLASWATRRFPELHVLLQTGYAEDGAGEFPALRKPFTADELVEAILGVLQPTLT
jgi:CheY-like chemotaxis protein